MGKFNGFSALIITALSQFIVITILGFIEEGSGLIIAFSLPIVLGGGGLAIYLAKNKDLVIAGWSGAFLFILNDLRLFEFSFWNSVGTWGILFLVSLLGAFIAKKLLFTTVK